MTKCAGTQITMAIQRYRIEWGITWNNVRLNVLQKRKYGKISFQKKVAKVLTTKKAMIDQISIDAHFNTRYCIDKTSKNFRWPIWVAAKPKQARSHASCLMRRSELYYFNAKQKVWTTKWGVEIVVLRNNWEVEVREICRLDEIMKAIQSKLEQLF